MSKTFPTPPTAVLHTLVTLFKQSHPRLSEILADCTMRFEEETDDSNRYMNDTSTHFNMIVEMPPTLYAEYEANLEGVEQQIKGKLAAISRGAPGSNWIDSISFALQMRQDGVFVPADEKAVNRIWQSGMFRLFISHRSEEKDAATKLTKDLCAYYISGFVAHEAIEPSEEWEAEILNGLRSMQAMLVLVTGNLHKSTWCNQEIGFALGRGIPIIPLCIDGNLPKGFIAKVQGKHTGLAHAGLMAENIVDTLSKNGRTSLLMRECLIEGLIHSKNFIATSAVYNKIAELPDLSKEEAERMKSAFTNDQVSNYGASNKIKALIQQHYPRWGKERPPLPDDEDIPF